MFGGVVLCSVVFPVDLCLFCCVFVCAVACAICLCLHSVTLHFLFVFVVSTFNIILVKRVHPLTKHSLKLTRAQSHSLVPQPDQTRAAQLQATQTRVRALRSASTRVTWPAVSRWPPACHSRIRPAPLNYKQLRPACARSGQLQPVSPDRQWADDRQHSNNCYTFIPHSHILHALNTLPHTVSHCTTTQTRRVRALQSVSTRVTWPAVSRWPPAFK